MLSRSLARARDMFADGVRDAASLRTAVVSMINAEPLAQLDYVSIAGAVTLEELTTVDSPALVSLAVRFGATRLIDNTMLEP